MKVVSRATQTARNYPKENLLPKKKGRTTSRGASGDPKTTMSAGPTRVMRQKLPLIPSFVHTYQAKARWEATRRHKQRPAPHRERKGKAEERKAREPRW